MSGVRFVQADPVSFQECPKCDFPLNVYFLELGVGDEKRTINVHVACGRCCWSENWGELKTPTEETDGGKRITA